MLKRNAMKFEEIVEQNLLPLLPAKALTRFASVSKDWNRWIKSPILAYHQSNTFKELSGFFCQNEFKVPTFLSLNPTSYGVPRPKLDFLPEPVDILSSCSGLLLCHGYDVSELYYICNPANKEWEALPKPHLFHGYGTGYSLAFEPSLRNIEGDYQLICAVPMFGLLYFELYSSKTNSWRTMNLTLVEMEGLSLKYNSFYMKGVAYWLTNTGRVLAIHLEKEVYEVIPLPTDCKSDGVLTQIRGEVCYITMSPYSGNTYSIAIYGGVDFSLKRDLEVSFGEEIELAKPFEVLPCFDGEKVMIMFGNVLYSFGINDQILRFISHVESNSAHAGKYHAYVNSMVQLH